ncbi:MAG TPA: hypothetical protein VGD61_10820 [Pyrinomonadaceae bacterium]
MIKVLSLLIAVSLLGGGVGACKLLCDPPTLRITGDSQKKDVFATFLGEYCDSLSNVRLTDTTTNVDVWNVDIHPGVAFCNFSFSLGNNAAFQEGVSQINVPANQNTFTLTPHTKYRITVRRVGSTSLCSVGSATFEF